MIELHLVLDQADRPAPARARGSAPWSRRSPPGSCPPSARRAAAASGSHASATAISRLALARRAPGCRGALAPPLPARPLVTSRSNSAAFSTHPRCKRAARAPQVEGARVDRLHRHAHVLEHRQVRKQVRDLKRLRDAEAHHDVLRPSRDVLVLEPDPARARLHLSRDQPEERRLPRAVRPDDRAQLPFVHVARSTRLTAMRLPNDRASASVRRRTGPGIAGQITRAISACQG